MTKSCWVRSSSGCASGCWITITPDAHVTIEVNGEKVYEGHAHTLKGNIHFDRPEGWAQSKWYPWDFTSNALMKDGKDMWIEGSLAGFSDPWFVRRP